MPLNNSEDSYEPGHCDVICGDAGCWSGDGGRHDRFPSRALRAGPGLQLDRLTDFAYLAATDMNFSCVAVAPSVCAGNASILSINSFAALSKIGINYRW
jgi:hypothetical protein